MGVSGYFNDDPTAKNSLFGAVRLTKNADIEKYHYSGYGIGFDRRSSFSFQGGGFGQNVIILVQIWVHLFILIMRKKTF